MPFNCLARTFPEPGIGTIFRGTIYYPDCLQSIPRLDGLLAFIRTSFSLCSPIVSTKSCRSGQKRYPSLDIRLNLGWSLKLKFLVLDRRCLWEKASKVPFLLAHFFSHTRTHARQCIGRKKLVQRLLVLSSHPSCPSFSQIWVWIFNWSIRAVSQVFKGTLSPHDLAINSQVIARDQMSLDCRRFLTQQLDPSPS